MSLAQLPTWLMERATPTIKGLETPADVERKQERRGRKGEPWQEKKRNFSIIQGERHTHSRLSLKRIKVVR